MLLALCEIPVGYFEITQKITHEMGLQYDMTMIKFLVVEMSKKNKRKGRTPNSGCPAMSACKAHHAMEYLRDIPTQRSSKEWCLGPKGVLHVRTIHVALLGIRPVLVEFVQFEV